MKKYTPDKPAFSNEFNIMERADLVNAQNHNASVIQLMDNEVALKKQIDSCLGSIEGDKPQFADGIKADNVVDAVNEVFQLGSEKKAQLAENLTAMGVASSASETWEQLLDKILDMTDTSKDTVTAAALLAGYTAHNAAGNKITGTLADKTGVADYSAEASLDATNSRLKLKVPAVAKYGIGNYLYAAYTAIASLIGLTAAKLVRGNTILGIAGNNNNMDTSGATAAAGDMLSGKKACVKGSLITGNMPNYAGQTMDATPTQDATYTYLTIPAWGYYDANSKLRTANFNIGKDIKISNITGYAAYSQGTVDVVVDVSDYNSMTVTCQIDHDGTFTHVCGNLSVTGNATGVLASLEANNSNGGSITRTVNISNDTSVTFHWVGTGADYAHQYGRFTNITLSKN